jgi:hypothetical protein
LAFLQLLLVPKSLIYVVGTICTIGRDLALLACDWHVSFFADVLICLDLVFVLGCLVRYISNPIIYYGYTIKELIQYLRSIIKQKLYFGPGGVNYYDYFVIYINID